MSILLLESCLASHLCCLLPWFPPCDENAVQLTQGAWEQALVLAQRDEAYQALLDERDAAVAERDALRQELRERSGGS